MAMADGNPTETVAAMVDGDRNGNGHQQWRWATVTATKMAMAIAMATATARVTMTKEGLPLHVPAMCSAVAGATPFLHPHGHKGKCIHQRCVMGVTLLRVFAPFQGGRVPDCSPWILFLFIIYNYCSVY